ncbi:DNA recombination protein RmuC [Candidatus Latescibacterota bacterium]
MDWIELVVGVVTGILLGFGAAFFFRIIHLKSVRELVEENETQQDDLFNKFLNLGKEKLESERELNTKELESKKGLIDQQLHNMKDELEKVSKLVTAFEKDRENKFGELSKQLEQAGNQTQELIKTTGTLSHALASSKVRGQWGERMAEDVLRVAGLKENINYEKQKTIEGIGSRPDYTFLLPKGRKLNMDVKFPFDNYIKYIETDSDAEKSTYLNSFLKDVRSRMKEVTNREYINPEQDTVDYVLLFIPNEQIFAFINEQDSSILDESISKRVIMCSPITLFAVLAVIRQSVENFALEQTSNEILSLLGRIKLQWDKFMASHDKLGTKIQSALDEYNIMKSTRRNQLERPMNKIEDIRKQRNIGIDKSELPEIADITDDEVDE